jgi:hypothetical protein
MSPLGRVRSPSGPGLQSRPWQHGRLGDATVPALPALDQLVFVLREGLPPLPSHFSPSAVARRQLIDNALLPQAWLGVVQQTVKLQNKIPDE